MYKHRYSLEKGSKKHICPGCNKRTFVFYIDTDTGNCLPKQYGRCDRESKCQYHLSPYKDGYSKEVWKQENGYKYNFEIRRPKPIRRPQPETVYFDYEAFKNTLSGYGRNVFIQNLLLNVPFTFDAKDVTKVIELYRLGTAVNGYRAGAVTFPFIDAKDNVRAIQVKQFNEQNHTTGTGFLHSIIEKHHTRNNKPLPEWLEAYNKNDTKVSCLFGEHLLNKYPHNPIALVEAPKTAIYGALYFGFPNVPKDLLWLAVYNKSSFLFDKLKTLKGRDVFVFPDLSKDGSTYKEWETKAKEYEKRLPETRFVFSDLLEQFATDADREQGNDIADVLIKQDWRLFREQKAKEPAPEPAKSKAPLPKVEVFKEKKKPQPKPVVKDIFTTEKLKPKPESWGNDIAELENYFANITLPTKPVRLNECSTITDCSLFIESHFATAKANNGKRKFLPYLNRLQHLKEIL